MLWQLFKVSRPISWINTAYPFAAGYLLLGGSVDAVFVIGSLFFLIPYNLLMYGVNDVYDYESDIRNPRKNSIEGAVEDRRFHPTILKAAGGLSLPFIIVLGVLSAWPAAVTLLVVVGSVLAYSMKGLRFKEKPFLDSITSSLHFTGPLLYAMALLGFPAAAWPCAIALFIWGIASHAFGAVQDVIPDREGGLHSIATVIGARATVIFSAAGYVTASVLIGWQGGGAIVIAAAGLLYVGNVMPYLTITDTTSALSHRGWQRFIWLNYVVGAIVTIVIITSFL